MEVVSYSAIGFNCDTLSFLPNFSYHFHYYDFQQKFLALLLVFMFVIFHSFTF
jgi:hypothetical protein